MIKYENDCVGCPDGVPCMGSTCPNRNVPHFYCDDCENEDDLYEFDGEQLCADCILARLKKVNE